MNSVFFLKKKIKTEGSSHADDHYTNVREMVECNIKKFLHTQPFFLLNGCLFRKTHPVGMWFPTKGGKSLIETSCSHDVMTYYCFQPLNVFFWRRGEARRAGIGGKGETVPHIGRRK